MKEGQRSSHVALSSRPRVTAALRRTVVTLLLLGTAGRLEGQGNPAELEEAADFARSAEKAAMAGPPRVFIEALDADGILESRLGPVRWRGLIERQRDQLRSAVREHFLRSLSADRTAQAGQISWSWASPAPSGKGADVMLGMKFGDRTLKTRWSVRRSTSGWHVADVILSDPGISLAEVSVQALGPEPVRRRDRRREAEKAAYPRLAGLAVIALLVVTVAPRLPRRKATLLLLTAAAPALLILIDGVLAARRTLAEAYALAPAPGRMPWREFEQRALQAEREGRGSEARQDWARAIARGAPPGPIDYQMGLQARQRGEIEQARGDFERALTRKPPAPGAEKELAAMDLAQGRDDQAGREIEDYLTLSGLDPESLSMLAVIQTNLGKTEEALDAIRRARSLVGDGWRGAELEAQVRARAGDAAGAVASLRPLEAEGRLDRSALRSDPAYLPIATDPAWISFIDEQPKSTADRATPPNRTGAGK